MAFTRAAGWAGSTFMVAACLFVDEGLQANGQQAGSSEPSTMSTGGGTTNEDSSGSPTTSTGETSSDAPTSGGPKCGDNIIHAPAELCDDGNTIDSDSCRSDCTPATCGDGVVWEGMEECDDGAANHPTLPVACRPDCQMPQCGDGGLYIGELGPPIDIGGGPGETSHGDDAPRAIGAASNGTFRVLWRSYDVVDGLFVQTLEADGQPLGAALHVSLPVSLDVRDPVIAVAGSDYLVAWEVNSNGGDLRVRAHLAGALEPGFVPHMTANTQEAASVGLSEVNTAVVAFLNQGVDTNTVMVRFVPDIGAPGAAPAEAVISEHVGGLASSPTVAMLPSGEFVVAWGDPSGTIVYRRFSADGQSDVLVTTALRLGGGADALNKQWTGVVLRPDASAAIVGRDPGGHLTLQLLDGLDNAQGQVQVAESDARYVPFVDVASDPWGNLAVAWTACGEPGDAEVDCTNLPSSGSLRWFHADLTPFGPSVSVTEKALGAAPLGLAVAQSGATGVTFVEDDAVIVRVASLQCP